MESVIRPRLTGWYLAVTVVVRSIARRHEQPGERAPGSPRVESRKLGCCAIG
jgi:hypothetical protein